MADLTLTYGDRVITTLDDAGKVILKTCGKYCAKDIIVEYAGGGSGSGNNILYNGNFSINTTGVTSWSAVNTGTSERSGVRIIDGWFLEECNAEKVSGGLKIIPKNSYGYLLYQINRWLVGKTVTITAVINDVVYTQTGIISSGASVEIATPFGSIYFYGYSDVSYYFTIQFENQINAEFIIKNVSVIAGGGGEEPSLPDEYQQVEYLGVSNGNQYCQISAPISAKDNVEVVVMDTATTTSEQGFIGVNNNTASWELFFKSGEIQAYGKITRSTTPYQKNTKYRIIGVLDDSTFESTFYFGRYRLDNYPFTGKLYELRIYISRFQKDYVWCHLVPCYRKSDSVPGFYDLISRVFYTNAGSGSFIVGPAVSLGTRLAPTHTDVPHGYVSNGTWVYDIDNVNCYSDIYSVEAGKLYKIELGATVSNRFRVMFSTTDVSEATGNVSGVAIIDRSNPSAYVYEYFEAPQNGYITIQKTNAAISNIPTFVYEVERT